MFRFKDLFKNPILQSQLDKANEVGATLAIELRNVKKQLHEECEENKKLHARISKINEMIKRQDEFDYVDNLKKENKKLKRAIKNTLAMDRFKGFYFDENYLIRRKND